MISSQLKKLFTLLILGLSLIITVATSKMKPPGNSVPSYYTNYRAESNCTGSVSQSKIEVLTDDGVFPLSEITKWIPISHERSASSPVINFTDLGFKSNSIHIGVENHSATDTEKKCVVKEVTTRPDNEASTRDKYSTYKLAKPDFFTKTTYDCFDKNQYECSIVLEELEPIPLSQIK